MLSDNNFDASEETATAIFKVKTNNMKQLTWTMQEAALLFDLHFYTDDGSIIFLRDVKLLSQNYLTPKKERSNCKSRTKTNYVRFEVFTAVTMKNAIFWDIKSQFVPHRRHITSPLPSKIWDFMNNVAFWDIKTQFIPHRRHITSSLAG
jgi:hypothetical protein